MGIWRCAGLGLAALILVFPAIHVSTSYAEQFHYNHLRTVGVETTALVMSVDVENVTEKTRNTSTKYVTWTRAQVAYKVRGQQAETQISARRQDQSNFTSQASYPPPAWKKGDRVTGYADPGNPNDFVEIDSLKEADADSMPRGAIVALWFTALLLIVPAVLIIVGTGNVKRAREL